MQDSGGGGRWGSLRGNIASARPSRTPPAPSMRSPTLLLLALVLTGIAPPAGLRAQAPAAATATELVRYANPRDGASLSGTLALPKGAGPFPGVVLLTLAGADPLIARL